MDMDTVQEGRVMPVSGFQRGGVPSHWAQQNDIVVGLSGEFGASDDGETTEEVLGNDTQPPEVRAGSRACRQRRRYEAELEGKVLPTKHS